MEGAGLRVRGAGLRGELRVADRVFVLIPIHARITADAVRVRVYCGVNDDLSDGYADRPTRKRV